jgi:hypothetical protein
MRGTSPALRCAHNQFEVAALAGIDEGLKIGKEIIVEWSKVSKYTLLPAI